MLLRTAPPQRLCLCVLGLESATAAGADRPASTSTMDRTFEDMLYEIQYSGYNELPKFLQMRVEKWVTKLAQPLTNRYWVRNRNEYARLLVYCIETRNFREPYDKNPPDGMLPALPFHLRLSKQYESTRAEFWNRLYRNSGDRGAAANSGGIITPRGNERWREIAPMLFDRSMDSEPAASSRRSTSAGRRSKRSSGGADITDIVAAPTPEQRHIRQLQLENGHLRTKMRQLARDVPVPPPQPPAAAAESLTSTVIKSVRSPRHSSFSVTGNDGATTTYSTTTTAADPPTIITSVRSPRGTSISVTGGDHASSRSFSSSTTNNITTTAAGTAINNSARSTAPATTSTLYISNANDSKLGDSVSTTTTVLRRTSTSPRRSPTTTTSITTSPRKEPKTSPQALPSPPKPLGRGAVGNSGGSSFVGGGGGGGGGKGSGFLGYSRSVQPVSDTSAVSTRLYTRSTTNNGSTQPARPLTSPVQSRAAAFDFTPASVTPRGGSLFGYGGRVVGGRGGGGGGGGGDGASGRTTAPAVGASEWLRPRALDLSPSPTTGPRPPPLSSSLLSSSPASPGMDSSLNGTLDAVRKQQVRTYWRC